MSAWAAAAAGAAVGGVALVSRRLTPTFVSGPMLLVAAGLACGPVGLDLLDVSRDEEAVKLLFEVTLVAVLFTDAAGVRWSVLRRDDALPLRLLGLGLPLTMVLGTVGAWLLLPGLTFWELALVAVILAPTDAALGQTCDRRSAGTGDGPPGTQRRERPERRHRPALLRAAARRGDRR